MKILITGGTGLIGSEIIRLLGSSSHEIHNLTTRSTFDRKKNGASYHFWNPSEGHIDNSVPAPDVIINLAGYSIANRWSKENKQRMVDSRLQSIATLVSKISTGEWNPQCIVSASASGFYNPKDTAVSETEPVGEGFLAELTADWENAWKPAEARGVRVVKLRISVVLDKSEGAVGTMLPFFKWGLGSAVGNGKQMVSWVHRTDVARAFIHAIDQPNMQGAFNVASPQVVSNRDFSKAMAKAMHKPFFLPPVPGFMIHLLFGEMAALVLQSKNITTNKLTETGFQYQFESIDHAMTDIFKS